MGEIKEYIWNILDCKGHPTMHRLSDISDLIPAANESETWTFKGYSVAIDVASCAFNLF